MTSRSIIASKAPVPPAALLVGAALFVLVGIGPNTPLVLLAITILLFGSALLWRPGESPILLFVFGFQWLQASLKAFHANWLGQDLAFSAFFGGDAPLAVSLSLFAVFAL